MDHPAPVVEEEGGRAEGLQGHVERRLHDGEPPQALLELEPPAERLHEQGEPFRLALRERMLAKGPHPGEKVRAVANEYADLVLTL